MTWFGAIVVGCAQIVAAIFPGTSRSGAGIFAAMLTGSNRAAAADFVFCWAFPPCTPPARKNYGRRPRRPNCPGGLGRCGTGFWGGHGVGVFVVKWLLGYIKSHRFTGFAIYRIILGLVLLTFFLNTNNAAF